jgi:outer membrane protein assembly factor BamA
LKSKPPAFAILPSFGYNPSLGFVIGAKMSAGKQYGHPSDTKYSVFGMEALYTSKGITTLQARHNVFIEKNKWNFQGNWQVARFGIIDYGLGTGDGDHNSNSFSIDEFPVTNSDSAFPIKYNYYRFTEKAYRLLLPHFYAGVGVSFDIRNRIDDEKEQNGFDTPHQLYSIRNGYDPKAYSANGLLLGFQYNTREHPFRSYGGIYADFLLRWNQQWMGSSKNALLVQYDLRKYWSLSKLNPEHVLAVWHRASYLLSGSLPYLEMPATGYDDYYRSGRAYTIGRFKGPSYAYLETEYRFPITRNKLISGVCFINFQTASTDMGQRLFSSIDTGEGLGFRFLLQKGSRTTLCMDVARGNYGAAGIFFGLNEAF